MTVVLASSGSLLLAQITFQSYLLGQMGATGEPYGSVLGNCEYSVTTIRWIILCSEVVRIKCSIIKVKRAFFRDDRDQIWHACADSDETGSHLNKLTHPSPPHLLINLFVSASVRCSGGGRCVDRSAMRRFTSLFGEVLLYQHQRIVTITKVYIATNNLHVKIIRFRKNFIQVYVCEAT